jgi:hypothetical protein
MRNVSTKRCRENQNTNFMSINFLSKFPAANEIMSKNVVKPQRPQVTIWRLVACWISKVTRAKAHACGCAHTPTRTHARTHMHTLTEICNTYCLSTTAVVSCTRLNITSYVHCLSCYYTDFRFFISAYTIFSVSNILIKLEHDITFITPS